MDIKPPSFTVKMTVSARLVNLPQWDWKKSDSSNPNHLHTKSNVPLSEFLPHPQKPPKNNPTEVIVQMGKSSAFSPAPRVRRWRKATNMEAGLSSCKQTILDFFTRPALPHVTSMSLDKTFKKQTHKQNPLCYCFPNMLHAAQATMPYSYRGFPPEQGSQGTGVQWPRLYG